MWKLWGLSENKCCFCGFFPPQEAQSMWLTDSLKPMPCMERWHVCPGSFLRQRAILVRFPPGFPVTLSAGAILILHCSSQSVTVISPCFSKRFFSGLSGFPQNFQGQYPCYKCGWRKWMHISEAMVCLRLSKWKVQFFGHWSCSLQDTSKKKPIILQIPLSNVFCFLGTVPSKLLPNFWVNLQRIWWLLSITSPSHLLFFLWNYFDHLQF